jgi:glucose/arabinose dehydrogenase
VTGWLNDQAQTYWGGPVDVKPATDGSLLISDDESGTVYRLIPLAGQ